MTNNQILDTVLHSYLYGQKLKLEGDPRYGKMTFEFIVKTQTKGENFEIEPWQMEFLRQTLLNDGFIKLPESGIEPYELTKEGIKAAQIGWYKKTARDAEIEKEIKSLTIEDLKRSKRNLVIAVLALIIPTIISIYSLIQTTNNNKDTELDKLRTEIQELKNDLKAISEKTCQ
jgi:hypothetical protein